MKKDKAMDRRGFLKMGMTAGGGMMALSAIPLQSYHFYSCLPAAVF